MVIGDINELRFRGKRIVISAITDADKECLGHIPVRRCYIDNIEFVGVEDTSEGMAPVYRGVMYSLRKGKRAEFSYEEGADSAGNHLLPINPIRIIYINDQYLCIANQDRDGLYYYRHYDREKDTQVYMITDRDYTPHNQKQYSTADLYQYTTERT